MSRQRLKAGRRIELHSGSRCRLQDAQCGFRRVYCSNSCLFLRKTCREDVFHDASCPGVDLPVIRRRWLTCGCLCVGLGALEVVMKVDAYQFDSRQCSRLGQLVAGLSSRLGWEGADGFPLVIRRAGGLCGLVIWPGFGTVGKDGQLWTLRFREMAHGMRRVVSEGWKGPPRCHYRELRFSCRWLVDLVAECS